MKGLYVIFTLVLFATPVHAQGISFGKESVDLENLYQQIDEAISLSPQYVAEREQQISVCRDSFLMEENLEKRLLKAEELFFLYKSYKNDSALHYADLCINLSDSLHRPDLTGRFRSLLASQCSNTNMQSEAIEQLRLVNRSALDKKGLVAYYSAWMHIYGELASYTQRQNARRSYFDKQDAYRDSVMMVAEEGSEEWFHLKMDILSAQRHFQDALTISNSWQKMVKKGTHESAYAAFYRSMVYCYWLGKSALDDILCAVMDQASLLFLAEQLANDGDLSRAQRYLEFSRACNTAFSPYMRAYQYYSVLNIIEKDKEAAHQRADLMLLVAGIVIILLLLALVILIVRRRK